MFFNRFPLKSLGVLLDNRVEIKYNLSYLVLEEGQSCSCEPVFFTAIIMKKGR
jgi:hypothetical protein